MTQVEIGEPRDVHEMPPHGRLAVLPHREISQTNQTLHEI